MLGVNVMAEQHTPAARKHVAYHVDSLLIAAHPCSLVKLVITGKAVEKEKGEEGG